MHCLHLQVEGTLKVQDQKKKIDIKTCWQSYQIIVNENDVHTSYGGRVCIPFTFSLPRSTTTGSKSMCNPYISSLRQRSRSARWDIGIHTFRKKFHNEDFWSKRCCTKRGDVCQVLFDHHSHAPLPRPRSLQYTMMICVPYGWTAVAADTRNRTRFI